MENLLDIYYFESDGIKRRDNVYRGGNAPINMRFFALFEILTRELIDNTRVGHRQVGCTTYNFITIIFEIWKFKKKKKKENFFHSRTKETV